MMRVTPGDPHNRPHTTFWAGVVWGFLILAPPSILVLTARAKTLEHAMARWVAGMSLFLAITVFLAAFVVIGLALPFACL
jgi:hypothetical protein